MTVEQVAVNDRALRSAAAKLEAAGYTGNAHAFVEGLVLAVIADGYRPLEPPPTPRGPGSTRQGREAARRIYDQTRREKETTEK